MSGIYTVSGAFGYSGKYIAGRLLRSGLNVQTLTHSTARANPFEGRVAAHPFYFDQPARLARILEGTKVLFNTYWIRYKYRDFNHDLAVRHSKMLIQAARKAGVERIVHTSITNPGRNSPLSYFSGKAEVEEAIKESGLSYAILRPAILFGPEDILINNIAWVLRRFPIFGLFGRGAYKLQPIYVDDFAELAVEKGLSRTNCIIDAIGPETFTYRELVTCIAHHLGKRRLIVPMPRRFVHWMAMGIGYFKKDLTLTWEEIQGLTGNLLCTSSPPAGRTKLTDWIADHRNSLGIHYANELSRRLNQDLAYEDLERKS
jgi:uncharacterized protein YbjT (DUF2867 family)